MTTKERMLSFASEFNTYFLPEVATVINQQLSFDATRVEPDAYLIDYLTSYAEGGKRIRPYIVHRLSQKDLHDEEVRTCCLSLELFHLMALIHDDIMDQSPQRRGVPTLHIALQKHKKHSSRLGEDVAILLGDSFLVASLTKARTLPEPTFFTITEMMQRTNRGQYLDALGMNDGYGETSEAVVATRNLLKTAWYTFATPAILGLQLSDIAYSEEELNAITLVYLELGMLFQIRDDILDGTAKDGKQPYEDIKDGQTTWVTLHIKQQYPEVFNQLQQVDRSDTHAVHQLLSSISFTEVYANEYAKCAQQVAGLKEINEDLYVISQEILELLTLS